MDNPIGGYRPLKSDKGFNSLTNIKRAIKPLRQSNTETDLKLNSITDSQKKPFTQSQTSN